MSLNDDFLETFILLVKGDIIKIVLNYTKGMYTVYAPNGRILVRVEKLLPSKLTQIQRQINDYINGNVNELPNFSSFRGFRTA